MCCKKVKTCFNTQPPEGGWASYALQDKRYLVSTHSRPKAAGRYGTSGRPNLLCFNTQPPEGGWGKTSLGVRRMIVSTHSRPKAAGLAVDDLHRVFVVSTHSRPKAAGFDRAFGFGWYSCFNTQPPEGGWPTTLPRISKPPLFQHTAARRRLDFASYALF